MTTETTYKRGFANLPLDRRREISRVGGRSLAKEKRAFALNPELARSAGAKGGQRVRPANDQDAKLLAQCLEDDGFQIIVPFGASGRTLRKVARLLRLGYLIPSDGCPGNDANAYRLTDAGRAFLAGAGHV